MNPNNDRRVNKLTTVLTHLKVYWWLWSILLGGLITAVNSMQDVRSIPTIKQDVLELKTKMKDHEVMITGVQKSLDRLNNFLDKLAERGLDR